MFTYALSLHYDALTCICWWHGDRIMTVYLWQEQTGGTQSKEAAQGRRTPRLLQPFGIQVVCTTRSAMPGLHVWFECRAAWGPGTEGQPILIFSLSLCPKRRFLQNLQLCWYYLLWMMRYSVLCSLVSLCSSTRLKLCLSNIIFLHTIMLLTYYQLTSLDVNFPPVISF